MKEILFSDNVFTANILAFLFSFIDLTFITQSNIEFFLRTGVMSSSIIYTVIQIIKANKDKKK